MEGVLGIYHCLIKYHKPSGLKPHPSSIPPFPWVGSLGTTGSSARLQSGVGQGLGSRLRLNKKDLLQSSDSCWWHSFPCGLLD